jgi:hypothetical protein
MPVGFWKNMIKWFVRLGSVIGLLVIAFVFVLLLLGRDGRYTRTEAQIDIARPASVVFPWLSEGPLLLKWVSGLESYVPNGQEPRLGLRAHMVQIQRGCRFEMIQETTACSPPTLLQLRLSHAEFSSVIEYTLVEQNGHTSLTQRATTNYHDFMTRLLLPLFAKDMDRALFQDLLKLRTLLESEPVSAPPSPSETGFQGCCAPEAK